MMLLKRVLKGWKITSQLFHLPTRFCRTAITGESRSFLPRMHCKIFPWSCLVYPSYNLHDKLLTSLKNLSISPLITKELILPSEDSHKVYSLPCTVPKETVLQFELPAIAQIEKFDPDISSIEVVDPLLPFTTSKEALNMLQIRRRKMKKHKLKKLRKRMRFVWARQRLNREIKKEKLFQAELMAQIKEATEFDAEKYVHDMLHRIKERPKIETPQERYDKIRELKIKYRSNVELIKPKFED